MYYICNFYRTYMFIIFFRYLLIIGIFGCLLYVQNWLDLRSIKNDKIQRVKIYLKMYNRLEMKKMISFHN